MKQRILILCPYPSDEAPSQRFRFEQYIEFLKNNNFEIEQHSFLDHKTWHQLYLPGHVVSKLFGILKGFLLRFILMFTLSKYDLVFIHREASPLGPPIFEWIITHLWKKKCIYDFDDAIWMENTSQQNALAKWFKYHHKVKLICSWVNTVTTGNTFLQSFANNYNNKNYFLPTTLIVPELKGIKKDNNHINIGWTGSHSTLKYLDIIIPVLDTLFAQHTFTLTVIANQPPTWNREYLRFKKWDKKTETEDLLTFDIGLMPLEDNKWANGKCGFKALQYMALGIPVIASNVGVNNEIIQHGSNGLLAQNSTKWQDGIIRLMNNPEDRLSFGKNGYKTVLDNYSVESQKNNYLKIFKDTIES